MAPTRKPTTQLSRRSERMQLANAIKLSEQEAKAKSGNLKKKQRFRRPKQRKSCTLLKLPGEIRNHIYRFALVQSEEVKIDTNGPGVCRRIRTEARSIYYIENKFCLQIIDFNGAKFIPFAQQYNDFNFLTNEDNVTFRMREDPDRANLAEWVKAGHAGTVMQPQTSKCESPNDFVLADAFDLGRTMRFWPANLLEGALENMRKSLTATPWGLDDEWWDFM